MSVNSLTFLQNLTTVDDFSLAGLYSGQNRINNAGEALEVFVKDVLCGSLGTVGIEEKNRLHAESLSYLGNQNNPPDFIIKNGDAFEVKKLLNSPKSLALNSSYPKAKLYRTDTRISETCRGVDGGVWTEKDIVYTVGYMAETKLKTLWLVYGDCYAADKEVYERPLNQISAHLEDLPGIEVASTNEISRLNKVDPLGATYLRVRGMWGIDAPHTLFNQYVTNVPDSDFSAFVVMLRSKYDSFPSNDKQAIVDNQHIEIKEIEIPSPNNPAESLPAILLSFQPVV